MHSTLATLDTGNIRICTQQLGRKEERGKKNTKLLSCWTQKLFQLYVLQIVYPAFGKIIPLWQCTFMWFSSFLIQAKSNTTFSSSDSLSHNVFRHLWDLAPLFLWKFKTPCHDLFPHVLWDCPTVVFGVERRVSTQHHVDNDTQGPQVTALKARKRSLWGAICSKQWCTYVKSFTQFPTKTGAQLSLLLKTHPNTFTDLLLLSHKVKVTSEINFTNYFSPH